MRVFSRCLFNCSTSTREKTTRGVASTYEMGHEANGTGLCLGPTFRRGFETAFVYERGVGVEGGSP